MSVSIASGGLLTKDPDAVELFTMDWNIRGALADGVEIDASTWEIAGPDNALTFASPTVLAGNRKAQAIFSGGTLGATYTVTNRIVTNESPAQRKDRSFKVLIEES